MTSLTQSYSHLAAEYDKKRFTGQNGEFLSSVDRDIICEFVERAGVRRLLDVPVGTGRVLAYLYDMDVEITGLDLTPEMLEFARRVAHPTRHQLQQGDASKLPFPDNSFDGLSSLRFFHLFDRDSRPAFSREFLRVVRPGGYLIVSFTNGWYAGGVGWLRKLLGLRTVYFEYAGEVKQLFPGCSIVASCGNVLPKQWLVDRVPVVGRFLRSLTRRFPFSRVCRERYYLLQKPQTSLP